MALIELFSGLIALALTITLPGYFLTLGFFPDKNEIDSIERLTFSLVFSVSFLPLLVLIENQVFGVPIDFNSSIATVLLIIIIGLVSWMIRTQKIVVSDKFYWLFPKVEKQNAIDLFFVSFLRKKS